ncbi:MAG: ATP-dependent 6-phosphofructokinase [Candidatus Aceula meridiana]|nr:ATP-dependent 6-phosphofructokinase [Candidatus Aceula meridiana]
MKKIGILTGGADCPGLNSVIRAVVCKGLHHGYVITGIKNGWQGLIDNDMKVLDLNSVSGILDRGGTILGTSRINPLENPDQIKKISENYKRSGIDALIVVGGEATFRIASELQKRKVIRVIGVPKSIDNSLSGTDYAFGFDTAVNIATECIDRLHTTAESHHRIMVAEVMGRYTGWVALEAGIAGGANIVLVPEIPVDIEAVCKALKNRHQCGRTSSIVIVSEGVTCKDHPEFFKTISEKKMHTFGGISELIARMIESETGFDTRVSMLGYIQRGGIPSAYDRLIGTRFGVHAIELVEEEKFGHMVSLRNNRLHSVPIEEAIEKRKTINMDIYDMARVFFAE